MDLDLASGLCTEFDERIDAEAINQRYRIRGTLAGSVYAEIAPDAIAGKAWLGKSCPLRRIQELEMTIVTILIIAALIATIVVLGLGLRSMARGGSYDREHAEKFMWERVALQALVIVLLIAAVLMSE